MPFDRRFRGEEGEIPAATLDARLSQPSELSGLLNRALDALDRLRTRGRLTETASTRAAFDEFHAMTDPFAVWLDGDTIDGPELVVGKKTLRKAYNDAATSAGRPGLSAKAITAAMAKLRPAVEEKQRTIHGNVEWAYLGIGLSAGDSRD